MTEKTNNQLRGAASAWSDYSDLRASGDEGAGSGGKSRSDEA